MQKINVLVVSKLEMHSTFAEEIASVSPSIAVSEATDLFLGELHREGAHSLQVTYLEEEVTRDLVRRHKPSRSSESLDVLLREAEVIFAMLAYPENLMARCPRLKWLHLGSAGIDRFQDSDLCQSRITVTNSSGALAVPIAEHVMAFVFMLSKGALHLAALKTERRWERFHTVELAEKTVGVVGMGAIGSRVATLAKGVGMRVIGTRRSAVEKQYGVGAFDEVFPRADLHEMLGKSDFVVLALPLTKETEKLIGERELRAMKSSASIINIGRGPVIDEPMLIRALKEGWIAGAGLDVAAVEPLSAESELWGMPNVILSPHMAGWTERRSRWVSKLFCDNLRRYISGEKLLNLMERGKDY